MSFTIDTRIEPKRGCGYRKPGGLYLVGDQFNADCGRLPMPLDVCPTCSAGIKPSRGWTWVAPRQLAQSNPCKLADECDGGCPMSDYRLPETAGLLWIGEKFYPTAEDFLREGLELGLSRRLSVIPMHFELGETLVLLAHRLGVPAPRGSDEEPAAGIFAAFTPKAIDYIVKGDETDDELQALADRGYTLVKVEQEETTELAPGERIR